MKTRRTPLGVWLPLAAFSLFVSMSHAQNLVINGNFNSGNTGFTSAYSYTTDLVPEFTYAIGTDPASFHNYTYTIGDHTTGTGNMMIVNPGSTPGQAAWRQTVGVTPNSIYNVSAWTMGWYVFEPVAADVRLQINGTPVGSDLVLNTPTDSAWKEFGGLWNSGTATSATIEIVDLQTALEGNDFSLDDVSMEAVPEPGSGVLLLGGAVALPLVRQGTRRVSATTSRACQ